MHLLATHVVPHSTGDKYLRLYSGDLTQIPPSEGVDILVVSAFPNDYVPTSRSLIGALYRKGLSVYEFSKNKEVDLRATFSSWLSRDLSERFPQVGFRRILCFETPRLAEPPEAVGDIFRAIMPFALGEPPIRSIAMPLLAAGDQGYDAEVMLRAIFDATTHWLAAGLPLREVKLVIHNPDMIDRLSGVFAELGNTKSSPRQSAAPLPDSDVPYHFFVSYAHDDTPEVDVLVSGLKAAVRSLRIFQNKLELNVGQSWQAELDHALESCERVVAVYSPSYLESKMCIEEFNMARLRHRESKTPVLKPVYLRTASLPLYMRTLQYIDCREADRNLLSAATTRLVADVGT